MVDQSPPRHYESHIAYPILILFVLTEIVSIVSINLTDYRAFFSTMAVAAFILTALYYRIQILVDQKMIYWSYGIGLFQREIDLHGIAQCQVHPNRFLTTWIFTPTSESALELIMRDDRSVFIPTGFARKIAGLVRS